MRTTFTKALAASLIIMLWGFQSNVYSQVDATINPLPLLWGSVNVGVDLGLTENISTELQIGLTSRNQESTGTNTKYTGFPVSVLGKYYFSPNQGADRFYTNVFLRYVTRSYEVTFFDDDPFKYRSTRMGAGIGAGYKIVSRGNFVFDINLGLGRAFYSKTVVESGEDEFFVEWPDLMIVGKLGLGYRF